MPVAQANFLDKQGKPGKPAREKSSGMDKGVDVKSQKNSASQHQKQPFCNLQELISHSCILTVIKGNGYTYDKPVIKGTDRGI